MSGLRGRPCSHLAMRPHKHGATPPARSAPLPPAPLPFSWSLLVLSCHLNGVPGDEVSAYVRLSLPFQLDFARVRRPGGAKETSSSLQQLVLPGLAPFPEPCVTLIGFLLPPCEGRHRWGTGLRSGVTCPRSPIKTIQIPQPESESGWSWP